MKIAVFGATGGTGQQIVRQALQRGHEVTAFARRPRGVVVERPEVNVVQGDVRDLEKVRKAVAGQDAVLNALGTSRGSPRDICSAGTKTIIEAMKAEGVSRLITETAYGASETRDAGAYSKVLRVVMKSLMDDKDVQEQAIRDSGLQHVIVRPPRLTNGERRGAYKAGADVGMTFFSKVSRADVADFMLKQIEGDRYVGQAPGIRY